MNEDKIKEIYNLIPEGYLGNKEELSQIIESEGLSGVYNLIPEGFYDSKNDFLNEFEVSFTDGSMEQQEQPIEPLNQSGEPLVISKTKDELVADKLYEDAVKEYTKEDVINLKPLEDKNKPPEQTINSLSSKDGIDIETAKKTVIAESNALKEKAVLIEQKNKDLSSFLEIVKKEESKLIEEYELDPSVVSTEFYKSKVASTQEMYDSYNTELKANQKEYLLFYNKNREINDYSKFLEKKQENINQATSKIAKDIRIATSGVGGYLASEAVGSAINFTESFLIAGAAGFAAQPFDEGESDDSFVTPEKIKEKLSELKSLDYSESQIDSYKKAMFRKIKTQERNKDIKSNLVKFGMDRVESANIRTKDWGLTNSISKIDSSNPLDYIAFAINASAEIAPQLVLTKATGGLGTFVATSGSMYIDAVSKQVDAEMERSGSTREEAFEVVMSDTKINKLGLNTGALVVSALDYAGSLKILGGAGKEVQKKLVKEMLDDVVLSKTGKILKTGKEFVEGQLIEIGTELTQEGVEAEATSMSIGNKFGEGLKEFTVDETIDLIAKVAIGTAGPQIVQAASSNNFSNNLIKSIANDFEAKTFAFEQIDARILKGEVTQIQADKIKAKIDKKMAHVKDLSKMISEDNIEEAMQLQDEWDSLEEQISTNTTGLKSLLKSKQKEVQTKLEELANAKPVDMESNIESVETKVPTSETNDVAKLRQDEQDEMLEKIPNAKDFLTNGKVDRDKIDSEEGKAKFDEIYGKYDKLITPLLDNAPLETKEKIKLKEGELSTESIYNKKVDENNEDFVNSSNEFKDKAADYDDGISDSKFIEENTIEEEVDINDIIPTQDKLFEKSLNNKSTGKPILIKVGDKYYVEDGHHRIADKIISGGGKINATVYDSSLINDVESSSETNVDEKLQKTNKVEKGLDKLRNEFKSKPAAKDSESSKKSPKAEPVEEAKAEPVKEIKPEEESIGSTESTTPKIESGKDKKQKPRKTKKKPLKKEKVKKVEKATKDSIGNDVGTIDTSEEGLNHAKDASGVAYEISDKVGLVQGFSNITGRPIYVAYKGNSRTRVSIDDYSGKLFSESELKKLKELKEKLVQKESENQKKAGNPFEKQGRVASTDSVPKNIKEFVSKITEKLGVSKNIFIISDSDTNEAQFRKHGLFGTLSQVRSAMLSSKNPNEFGSKRYMSDADAYYIYYDDNLTTAQIFTLISHEAGHIIEQEVFNNQPKEVQEKIKSEYLNWYANLTGKTVSDVTNETRDITIQDLFAGNTNQFNPRSHGYISSFSEYFADNVSKWVRTSEKPKSVVEKMFKDIADYFKQIVNYLKNTGNYSESIFEWLDGIYETDISGKNPENEMLSKMSSSDSTPSIKDILEFAKDNNIDDSDVRSYMLELGYTEDEVNSAIKSKNKKTSQSVYSETRGLSERDYFVQGFEEVYKYLKNEIKSMKDAHAEKIKGLKEDSKKKKEAERELIEKLSLSIEAILPKDGVVSRSVAIQLSKANTVARVEAVIDRLERLATKNYEKQLKAIKDKASGDILNNLLNKKNWIGKKEEGKPRKKKLTDKVISILKEMASVYNEDKLDSMSADEIVALQKEINELISESKLEVKLINSAKKKVRKAFSGRITEMIARKNNKKKPLNSREDAVSLLKSGSVVVIDGVTFNSLKDFELAYPEGTKISGESVYIPSQPGLSMSGIKSRLLGRFSKILDLQGLLETFTQSSEDKSLIYEQILKPSSDKFYGKDNDIQKLDKARRKLVIETLNKGKGLAGAISKVYRLYEKSGISFTNKSGEKSLEITNDNAIYLYNAFKQLDGVEKFIGSGYSLKEVSAVIDYINSNQDLKAYADGLNSIYSEYLPSINESLVSNGFESIAEATTKSKEDLAKKNGEEFANDYYEILSKIYGGEQNIPAIERYSPISVSSKEIDGMQNTNIFDSKSFNISAFAPNVFERSKGGTLNIRSSTSVFNSYSDSMTNMVHSLDLLKKFQSFMTAENRRLIVDNYGKQFYQSIENSMNDIIYGKAKSTMSDAESYSSMKQWLNNANASVMFINFKSAATQLLSATNFALESDISFSDYMNNAFNYSSKEMVTARKELSEALAIEYRGDRNASSIEIDALRNSEFGDKDVTQNASHFISSTLSKGYYFTSKADVFAIKLGGAPYYMAKRNEFYAENIASGMEKTKAYEDAKDRALKKTYEVANKTQQSSNLDRVSAEQKDPLSRLVLTFGTVSMQYNREMISAARDIRNGRGDLSNNLAKIVYYGTIQNVIFQTISAAMGAIGGEDDEVKGATIINRSIDSLLKGFGVYGVAASAAKNGLYDFYSYVKRKQNENGELSNADKKALEELANINFDKKTYKEPKEVILNTVSSISPAIGGKIKQSVGLFYQAGNGEYTKAVLNSINFASNVPADRLLDLTDAFNEDLSGFHRLARITNVMKNYEVEKNLEENKDKTKTSGRKTSGRDTSGRNVSSGRKVSGRVTSGRNN